MRVVGVVAEYDPFHLGHAHHLAEARRLSRADYTVVVLSSCFTQRGEAAILSPWERAEMALRGGADAVVALPTLWSVRDAEHFALGGVSLLTEMGVDALSFGAETADTRLLQQAADLLTTPDGSLKSALTPLLARGLPYPAALSEAAELVQPGLGRLLASPNNTLGICYLRALKQLGRTADIFPVTRTNAYHGTALCDGFSSASAIRGAIFRGDWQALAAMPPAAAQLLLNAAQAGHLHRPEALDTLLLARLRTMSPADLAALPDLSEGIEHRLRRAAETSLSRQALLQAAKTRRYPYARLSRLCAHAMLGMTQALVDANPLPSAAWLLGYRAEARPLLTRLSQGRLPLIGRSADFSDSEPWVPLERRALELFGLGAHRDGNLLEHHGVVRV